MSPVTSDGRSPLGPGARKRTIAMDSAFARLVDPPKPREERPGGAQGRSVHAACKLDSGVAAHCAIIIGDWEEPSGGSRLNPLGLGQWEFESPRPHQIPSEVRWLGMSL